MEFLGIYCDLLLYSGYLGRATSIINHAAIFSRKGDMQLVCI